MSLENAVQRSKHTTLINNLDRQGSTLTTTTPVAIIGAGLAGLNTTRRLFEAAIGFLLMEARGRLGGRILWVNAEGRPNADGLTSARSGSG